MSIVTTTSVADDEPAPNQVGELGKFRLKKLTKFIKPLTSIAQPLMSMGKGGGLLTAMGPWGWAAGAVLAAGGTAAAMAARHQRKKRLAREQQQQQQQAAAAAAQNYQPAEPPPMMPPSYDQPSTDSSYPSPNTATPEATTLPETPPSNAPMPSAEVATPFPISMQPAEESPPSMSNPKSKPCSLPISPCQYEFVLLMAEGGVKHSSLEGAACPGPTMNSNMFLWATSA
jgi:hypothetical protein